MQTYNAYIRQFPQVITAKVIGKGAREYFELTTPGAAEAPKVNFGQPAAGQPAAPAQGGETKR